MPADVRAAILTHYLPGERGTDARWLIEGALEHGLHDAVPRDRPHAILSPMPVVLLHALARTRWSMRTLARHLARSGHDVVSLDYRSTRATLPELASGIVRQLGERGIALDESTSFVGHSMGGLVYRALSLAVPGLRTGPSVTIGTPLLGSTVARSLSRFAFARRVYGPAFATLSEQGVATLPPLPGPTLAIAGTHASPFVPAYWVLRALGDERPSDSTVVVDEALSPDARAHARVHAAHTFLPSHPEVLRLVARFLADPTSFESISNRPVVGLFVGGKSSRMGVPKGRLVGVDGTTLLERLAKVAARFGDVVLVGDASAYDDLVPTVQRLSDQPPGIGPLGGLAALLDFANGRDAIALACDLPFADEATLAALLARRSERTIVALRSEESAPFEPLFARYTRHAIPFVRDAIANEDHSLQRLLATAQAEWFTPGDRRAIRDWDTPEDVAADGGPIVRPR